jgi:hypothetical protein
MVARPEVDKLDGACRKRVPVRSGRNFRIDSPPHFALVASDLANELERIFERFGLLAKQGRGVRVGIYFKPGIFGHHKVGRAADIYAVGGRGLDEWKWLWDDAWRRCSCIPDKRRRRRTWMKEQNKNLGWQLYKALQTCGHWSKPYGYPIQLFGPWTRTEGPWKQISDFLLNAHRDHIHVAK